MTEPIRAMVNGGIMGHEVGKVPCITMMASGNLSLLITQDVSWESFADQAQHVMDQFGDKVIERINTPVERMWRVMIKGSEFWLSFEDFPLGLSLDSRRSSCDPIIRELHSALVAGNS